MKERFEKLVTIFSALLGSIWGFIYCIVVCVWYALATPDKPDVAINCTFFLALFLIQNGQNRETKALQLKLDEIILSLEDTDNKFAQIEKLTEEELCELENKVKELKDKI